MSRPRICVVGGGLAGMAAALACADGGAAVSLFERRRRLGGATWSFSHNGLTFDNGQHVFLRCCTAYRGFLDRLGVADRVRLQPRLDVPVVTPGGRTARLRRDGLPAPLHLARSLLGYGHLSLADRLRLLPAAAALRRVDLDDPATDRQTFGEWLARHRQSTRAREVLWDLICRPTVNVGVDEASLTLAAMVFQVGLLTEADAADIGWAAIPLGELHGDAGRRALVDAGVEVLTGIGASTVEPSSPTDDGKGDVAYTVRTGQVERQADAVIVAVPHGDVAAVCHALDVPALEGVGQQLGASPIVNVHVVYDRRVTPLEMAAAVDSDVQFVFDRSRAAGLERGQYLAVSLSAADREMTEPTADVKARITAALAELFPAARHAQVVDTLVSREPQATFRGGPRSRSARLSGETSRRGLVLAGAWTDTGWPATMEGAVRSGQAAAQRALGTVEHTRTPEQPDNGGEPGRVEVMT